MGFKTINGKTVFIPEPPRIEDGIRIQESVITHEQDKQQEKFVIPELSIKSNQELKKISRDFNFSPKIQAEAIKILKQRASKGQVDFNIS